MSWWVVAGHIATSLAFSNFHNDLPVDVFIILSGFVIFRLIDLKREAYIPFITRRAFRLFPAYLLALAISVLLLPVSQQVFANLPFQGPANATRVQLAMEAQRHFWPHFFVHLSLLQGLVPGWLLKSSPLTLVGQAWSVSLEWQFYLVAPLAFYAIQHRRLWLPLAIAIVVLTLTTRYVTTAYLGAKVLMFGVGLGSYLYVRAVETGKPLLPALGCWGAFAALSIAKGGLIEIVPLGLWAIVLFATLSPPRTLLRRVNDILDAPILLRLGAISYSTYLIHMVALVSTGWVLNHFGLPRTAYAILLAALTVALTYFLSEAMFRWVETPMNKFGQRAAKAIARRQEPALGNIAVVAADSAKIQA